MVLGFQGSHAGTGDTVVVQGFDHFLHQNCNMGNGVFAFPPDSQSFYKIMLRYELSCPPGMGCDIYDRIATLKVIRKTGAIDSTLQVAPAFKVDGNTLDSLQYMTDTSWTYTYNSVTHQVDSMPLSSLQVIFYSDSVDPFLPTDTLVVWPAYYNQYIFDTSGTAIDSMAVPPDSVIYLTSDSIYTPFEVTEAIEIARAITPYGQGVVLWFDVSDYRPLLTDSVHLNSRACGYSNGWEVTTDFYFIEGIPPLRPYKVTNLWNGTWPYGNTGNPIDSHLQPITLQVDTQSVYEKVRLITTGHGFGCFPNQNVAEFYDVTHQLLINGNSKLQRLWRSDCGRNPLYPQGAPGYFSTWFYKRANWCPGSYVTPHDFNATDLVAGDSLRVDYNMAPYTVTSVPSGAYAPEYYIQSHAVFYDDIHYTNNAAILEVRRPNDEFPYRRMNPICEEYQPEVIIKNYGSANLQQVNIQYGVDGAWNNSYAWTGNLGFLDSTVVLLPAVTFSAGSHTFDVALDSPNGMSDEFAWDDTIRVNFTATNVFPTNFIVIQIKTDNDPSETSWKVSDDQGSILFSRNIFPAALTTYTDTVVLPSGCFNVTVKDAFGDGICCYNPTPPNNGQLRIYQGASGTPLVNSGDFGESYSLNFTLDATAGISENYLEERLFVFPNPAWKHITINSSVPNGEISLQVLDQSGRTLTPRMEGRVDNHSAGFEIPELADGLYYLDIHLNGASFTRKIIVSKSAGH